jgi:hypothetical protein
MILANMQAVGTSLNHFLLTLIMSSLLSYYFRPTLKDNKEVVTTSELHSLLCDLRDKSPDTCIRFRLIGKMWNDSFLNVRAVTEKGAVFENCNASSGVIGIPDLSNIIQFELENAFGNYQPHHHYLVLP